MLLQEPPDNHIFVKEVGQETVQTHHSAQLSFLRDILPPQCPPMPPGAYSTGALFCSNTRVRHLIVDC